MPATTLPSNSRPRTLATYRDRAIVAQRVDITVELRDEPANGEGESYVIESELTSEVELDAIVADYQATADRIEDIPMKRCWF